MYLAGFSIFGGFLSLFFPCHLLLWIRPTDVFPEWFTAACVSMGKFNDQGVPALTVSRVRHSSHHPEYQGGATQKYQTGKLGRSNDGSRSYLAGCRTYAQSSHLDLSTGVEYTFHNSPYGQEQVAKEEWLVQVQDSCVTEAAGGEATRPSQEGTWRVEPVDASSSWDRLDGTPRVTATASKSRNSMGETITESPRLLYFWLVGLLARPEDRRGGRQEATRGRVPLGRLQSAYAMQLAVFRCDPVHRAHYGPSVSG